MGFIEQVFDEIAEKVFEDTTGRELETVIVLFSVFMTVIQIVATLAGVNLWSAS
ncbi:hypothetical protein [Periweissella ghanensis]|uniref:Uncharacterized protein n=1 Tax=Periweissella ghanensis TaxID=467997 RepID=A0ABN8BR24_9LACO|nr:hypothetical protein [Periweissella ghanensis]MCM0600333.1 hypothetical protein [Periweissella ghanensis]CAH0419245.1 hypothetical protein WGH24286_01692 [Periweissella ghanensis]